MTTEQLTDLKKEMLTALACLQMQVPLLLTEDVIGKVLRYCEALEDRIPQGE